MHIKILQHIIDIIRGKVKLKFVKENTIVKEYKVPYIPPKKNFKTLICLTGFGHSGSGAILDFLSEYNNTTVYGYHDSYCSGFINTKDSGYEMDFIRCVGGFFDLEKVFNSSGYYNDDHAIKVFLHVVEYFYRKGSLFNDEVWKLCNEFVDELTDYKIPTENGFDGQYMFKLLSGWEKYSNLHTPLCIDCPENLRVLYSLKKINIDEYQKIAQKYILKILKTIESNEFLVLDQILSTSKAEIDRKLKYFKDFKLICCYRDPRDVYVTGILRNEQWIPRDPEIFVKWYIDRGVESYANEKHPNKLDIKFEDFILDHEKIVEKINKFIKNSETHHVYKNKYLILKKSVKNISIYKTYHDQKSISYIGSKLSKYCYNY